MACVPEILIEKSTVGSGGRARGDFALEMMPHPDIPCQEVSRIQPKN